MGSSDMQVIFPVFLFVIFLVVLSSFFVINNKTVELVTPGEVDLPFSPTPSFENKSRYENGTWTPVSEGPDLVQLFTGLGLVVGGGILIAVSGGLATPFVVLGVGAGLASITTGVFRTIGSAPGGDQFLMGIPIIGFIYGAMNYAATAIVSFGNLMLFTTGLLGGVVLACIVTPIAFMFFVFIIRFIRGQG